MDYSALQNDPDHPAGTSPWATSPQHNRTSFAQPAATADVPSSPLPPSAESPYPPDRFDDQQPTQGGADAVENGHEGTAPPSQAEPHPAPQQQSYEPGHQRREQQQQPSAQPRPRGPQYRLHAKITGLERTGRKDPILRFDIHTNLPKFRTTQFRDVRRTHSEFVKLAEHLISANPEAIVPAVPPPVTAAGAGTDEDEQRIKTSMQRWFNVVCASDVLIRDEEMMFFVESDFGYSPMVRKKQPATGVRRKVIKQFAPPPDDTPELQDARPVVKLFYLGTMDAQQKMERVVKARKSLGLAESDLGIKFAQMNGQEIHPGLANAYRKLGRVIQSTGDFHSAQGTAEAASFGDPLAYHSSDAFIVKETLTNRHILLRELLQAEQNTRSKLQAADRLKASSSVRRDKVDEAIAALEEAKTHQQYLGDKCRRVTQNLVRENRKWFDRTSQDLRASVREYVLREIEAERRTLATLEQVRPDIRQIDASGGLSRLGREAHPAVRRSSLASSQGPKGDAWSGVPRLGKDALARSVSGGFGAAAVPEEGDEEEAGEEASMGRNRAVSGASQAGDDDDDRIDAKNAASRLATTTF